MNWTTSLLVALLAGLAGMFASGFLAAMAVDWYHIPGREGESGYFVVLLALLGLIAGAAIGIAGSRIMAARAHPAFLRALGISLVATLLPIGGIGGMARLLADVPPEIDGEALLLVVQIRMPERDTTPPALIPGNGFVRLASIPAFSHAVRASDQGPLWKEDAWQQDGRWVVPGAVSIFTSRGKRMLEVSLDGEHTAGFLVPLPGHPGRKDLEWSEWLPRIPPGSPPLPIRYSYRFKALRWVDPVRQQTFGPFTVGTVASSFYAAQAPGRQGMEAVARFQVRFAGRLVTIDSSADSTEHAERMEEVAVIPGPPPALLLRSDPLNGSGSCALVSVRGTVLHQEPLPGCGGVTQGAPLSSDTTTFRTARAESSLRGWVDQERFRRPGLYLIGNSVVDSRTLAVHPFTWDTSAQLIPAVPPLGLSPDERSFVNFIYTEHSEDHPALLVTDFIGQRSYALAIDPARMRFADLYALDPAWLLHHFMWQRAKDGFDRLVEQPHFTPVPYQGRLWLESGVRNVYRIENGSAALREALVKFLAREFKGQPVVVDSGAYEFPVTIDGETVNVAWSSEFKYVAVSMPQDAKDTRIVITIGDRFNALLRTGTYDGLFGK
jgi:hypothetical protein